ncbi:TIGR03960 family B12-binding radical SAM protein [Eubacteriales bacterium OttesenSCG-928-K08]|nr:TIGR03960 family B12-binding radical SAM protein [Eubacteriales bacterium OttesenSCG-928-K08]
MLDISALDAILKNVEKPGRYTGGEWNIIVKEKAKLNIALGFPDVYEIGMSHLGSRILYHTLNLREDIRCERAYAPWTDMEEALREAGLPLFSLETKTPLAEFDIVGFSLLYEMCYTNILSMLELAGIPLLCADRNDLHPLIFAGGPCACNSEPLAEIVDAVMIGDGEELFLDVADVCLKAREQGLNRMETLKALANVPGVYVPGFYEATYNQGSFVEVKKLEKSAPDQPVRRIVKDLDSAPYIGKPIVPNIQIVHDRVALELFRGCTRGCRFCQAGYIYRPVRERKLETLLAMAKELIASTGYDELSLFSLSSSDYSCIHELIAELLEKTKAQHISLSLPSLRIDSFLQEELERMQSVRKAGLTFAPEAGTQRLRDVINKGVTEEDLLRSVTGAFEAGWTSVKLYFMIGLPTETDEDILGIAQLCKKVSRAFYSLPKEKRGKGLRLSVSASSFVPKPFTPFQWVAQDSVQELRRKQMLLSQALKGARGVEFKYHESGLSRLEAVFSRGDRRLGAVLIEAYRRGCRFDSWSEYFKPAAWEEAFEACGLTMDEYIYRERSVDEPLPWDHIDMLVDKNYLVAERENALKEIVTPDCRLGCNGCFGEKHADDCQLF